MPLSGLQISVWPCKCLMFDLLTTKLDRLIPLPRGPVAPRLVRSFSKYRVYRFGNKHRMDQQTGQQHNVSASLAWWRHKTSLHKLDNLNIVCDKCSHSTQVAPVLENTVMKEFIKNVH